MDGLFARFSAWNERRHILRDARVLGEIGDDTLAYDDNNPVNLARIALDLNDPQVALKHWRDAMVRCPGFAKTHKDSLNVMVRLKLFDDAEAIMRENIKRYPADPFYAGGYAQIAQEQRNFSEASDRWRIVMKRHPSWWKGYVGYAVCLCEIGQPDKADKVLSKAVTMFPREAIPMVEWARTAERRDEIAEALTRWQTVWDRLKHVAADIGIAQSLQRLKRFDEAEARLQEARTRWPLVEQNAIALARLSQERGDTEEAIRRWGDLKVRMPLLRFGYEGEFRLLRTLKRFDEAEAVIRLAKERFRNETWPDSELEANEQARRRVAQEAAHPPTP